VTVGGVLTSFTQSALLLQDVGALYMALKSASGGAAFAQFVCQRVLPVLALQPNEIEGESRSPCRVLNIHSRMTDAALLTALIPVLLGDDQKVLAQALVAISHSRRAQTH
jgi:hypothetical protein